MGVAGDWDGDGKDTTGVFRPSNGVIFLKNKNETGIADIALNYGLPGDQYLLNGLGVIRADDLETVAARSSGWRNRHRHGRGGIIISKIP